MNEAVPLSEINGKGEAIRDVSLASDLVHDRRKHSLTVPASVNCLDSRVSELNMMEALNLFHECEITSQRIGRGSLTVTSSSQLPRITSFEIGWARAFNEVAARNKRRKASRKTEALRFRRRHAPFVWRCRFCTKPTADSVEKWVLHDGSFLFFLEATAAHVTYYCSLKNEANSESTN